MIIIHRTCFVQIRRIALRIIPLAITLAVAERPAYAQTTTRVSVSSSGVQGSSLSQNPTISADGRYVAFESYANNLVPGDTNGRIDIFVHDRQTGETTRVSVSSTGEQGNNASIYPSISADGGYVTFYSAASNLVPGDTNERNDIFVHDRQTGQTTRVSVSSEGEQGNNSSTYPSISADGRFVAFRSHATNLVPGDTNNRSDVFVHDRLTGQTTRISVSSLGEQGNNDSSWIPSISADGRFLAFESFASNLVPGGTNGFSHIFVHDRQTAQTTHISVSSSGEQGNSDSYHTTITADGRYVAFESMASNLVTWDTNDNPDVFVHDRLTGETTHVSVKSSGGGAYFGGSMPSISADGRYVAFESWSYDIVPDDSNDVSDIFVRDRHKGQTARVSVSSSSEQSVDHSFFSAISADGRFVAFESLASNLVPGDTNGVVDVLVHTRASTCRGDTNGDGIVSFADFSTVLNQYGQSGWGLSGDLNGDGVVDFADFSNVLVNYGVSCP